jgi:hypothetical protein
MTSVKFVVQVMMQGAMGCVAAGRESGVILISSTPLPLPRWYFSVSHYSVLTNILWVLLLGLNEPATWLKICGDIFSTFLAFGQHETVGRIASSYTRIQEAAIREDRGGQVMAFKRL